MANYWIGLAVSSLVACYGLYAFVFVAWVTATPVSAEAHAQAARLADRWFSGVGAERREP